MGSVTVKLTPYVPKFLKSMKLNCTLSSCARETAQIKGQTSQQFRKQQQVERGEFSSWRSPAESIHATHSIYTLDVVQQPIFTVAEKVRGAGRFATFDCVSES